MEIAIIADTHMPRGRRRLPEACVARLRAAELILHAGDLMRLEVLDELESYGTVVAVHGNADDAEVRAKLPPVTSIDVDGVTIGLVHDAGPAGERLERLRRQLPAADAVVFGHSHIPLDQSGYGLRIFNPGSPTDRRRQPHGTVGVLRIEAGTLAEAAIVPVT